MAQDSGTPKFPAAIRNPLHSSSQDAEEEKTDPNLTLPPTPSSGPSKSAKPSDPPVEDEITSDDIPVPKREKTETPELNRSKPQTIQAPPTPQLPKGRMPDMGPLESFMKDPTVTEIMVNDIRNVMIEKEGKLAYSGFTYQNIDDLNRLTRNILDVTGRILSPDSPYVDTILGDGSRVNIVGPPLTLYGPCITIRKFPSRRLTINDLMKLEAVDQRIGYFLNVCVIGRMNILVCGGTGSGKTTFLNVLASFIPKGERIVVIEDTPELSIGHANSVRLQTKPQTPGSDPVTARDLVANSLRMRPDRIIVGECRRSEAFDMLQAMNTGHSGSMTTIHSNSARDGLSRLETLCMLASTDLPIAAIRKQITSALDLIIYIKRFRSGKRRITSICEVTGMEGDTITVQDIFQYELDASSGDAQTEIGTFKPTGLVPTFLDRLREQGIELPQHYFGI